MKIGTSIDKTFECRVVLDEILQPLALIWSHSSMMELLKSHVILLKPEVGSTERI